MALNLFRQLAVYLAPVLPRLAEQLSQQDIQPLGLPSPARLKRTLPRRETG